MTARPEPKRDHLGRYLIEGKAHTRATTISGTLSDQYGLTKWKMRNVATGLGQRKDLVALAATLDPSDDKRSLDRVCQDAMDAASASSGANVGTALHKATETIDAGGTAPAMPGDFNQRLDLYSRTLTEAGVRFDLEHIEQVLTIPDWNGDGTAAPIAGTCDRVAYLPDGRKVIADLKTGFNLDYSWQEIAMQLAIYAAHDRTYDAATDKLGPPVEGLDQTVGLIIHLPSSGPILCDLYLIDLVAGLEAVDYALWVRAWRKTKGLAEVYRPNRAPSPDVEWIRERIEHLAGNTSAVTLLRSTWPDRVPQPVPNHPSVEMVDQLAAVLDKVEAACEIPFGDSRPGQTKNPNERSKAHVET